MSGHNTYREKLEVPNDPKKQQWVYSVVFNFNLRNAVLSYGTFQPDEAISKGLPPPMIRREKSRSNGTSAADVGG